MQRTETKMQQRLANRLTDRIGLGEMGGKMMRPTFDERGKFTHTPRKAYVTWSHICRGMADG